MSNYCLHMEDIAPAKAPRRRTPMAQAPAPTLKELNLPAQQEEKPNVWVKPELPTTAEIPVELPPIVEPRTEAENKEWKLIITGDVA